MPSEYLRRLARELKLPDQAELVIQRPKFWTPEFCWLFFDRCDELIFHDPEAGLDVAHIAPELAELTERTMREPQPRLLLRALAILGSAFRRVEEFDQAEATYRQAFRIVERASVPAWDQGNLLFRFAALRTHQYRLEEAMGFADTSVGIYRDAPLEIRRLHLGESLIVRGYVHRRLGNADAAMRDFGAALSCTEVRLTPRIFFAAVHNVACGMVKSTVMAGTLGDIERFVAQARRYFNRKPRSLAKLKVLWLQGMVKIRFGSVGSGEKLLLRVRSGFLKMGQVVEMALVSITLARHYYGARRLDELRALAAETNELCAEFCKHEGVQRTVLIWSEAVMAQTVSLQVFSTTWQVLEDRSFEEAVQRSAAR